MSKKSDKASQYLSKKVK